VSGDSAMITVGIAHLTPDTVRVSGCLLWCSLESESVF
jgi:hypothetical protein